jgi:hypothetical protein
MIPIERQEKLFLFDFSFPMKRQYLSHRNENHLFNGTVVLFMVHRTINRNGHGKATSYRLTPLQALMGRKKLPILQFL